MVCDGAISIGDRNSHRPPGDQRMERSSTRPQEMGPIPPSHTKGTFEDSPWTRGEPERRSRHVVSRCIPPDTNAKLAKRIQTSMFIVYIVCAELYYHIAGISQGKFFAQTTCSVVHKVIICEICFCPRCCMKITKFTIQL